MKTIAKIALSAVIVLGMSATTASADVAKGQKLYQKKLKSGCGISGAAMAGKHTQGEWEELKEAGKVKAEIEKICPDLKGLKDDYINDLYDFFYEYGSDSGNVPSC
ncbi:MAG: cytochrome C [Epsilonproteobacteria bacterium]|nr:cytochrome C [Campylobacterota bacterium]